MRVRPEVWAAGDAASELRQVEAELDAIDLEVAGLRRIRSAQIRDLLGDLGFDGADRYPLTPLPRAIEQRSTSHPDESQLGQAILQQRVAAQGRRTIRWALRPVQRRQ